MLEPEEVDRLPAEINHICVVGEGGIHTAGAKGSPSAKVLDQRPAQGALRPRGRAPVSPGRSDLPALRQHAVAGATANGPRAGHGGVHRL